MMHDLYDADCDDDLMAILVGKWFMLRVNIVANGINISMSSIFAKSFIPF